MRRSRAAMLCLTLTGLAAACCFDLAATDYGNAVVTARNLNVRDNYPRFGFSTLLSFKLKQGAVVAVIPRGTRVTVLETKVVGDKYEWFHVRYKIDTAERSGWVYAGHPNQRQHVQLDPGAQLTEPAAAVRRAVGAAEDVVYTASNQEAAVVDDTPDRTDPLNTLLIGLSYVVVFFCVLVVVRRFVFKESAAFTFLTALAVLLVLGFITVDAFQDLLTTFVLP